MASGSSAVPSRPVLVAAAVSGSSCSGGLSRLAGTRVRIGSGAAGSGIRKRPLLTPLCNGLLNSYEDKSNDFVCYKCSHGSLEDNNRCPKCNYVVDNIDHLYSNFLGRKIQTSSSVIYHRGTEMR
ncbi:E3 ubiquitin-protein ligase COP1-like isoform X3 [Pituophis catenifer annectens]|uniref:E3 ubiquitin-protein ligase COP1-like isoform X3 n=1 Tax=Pituophis catenifer annectens TaxID=94852 RepID=UPI00399459E1